ncbi:PREDICTED: uncharacterized protein LOC104811453 isoform X2 [Tarenaya hassleriana]|uniref:uncharacterized protein LOC104811453 isoform X2 n=1 Tax=Tarenaya hassleriana TaxID=28532 RepID=UPI00053C8777|nr:PREDICTED: uncharacterized protein LOC104811453 isoform X2 [Tarenaya hassleriana]
MCVECGISITCKIPLGWESNEEFCHWSDVHQLVRCRFREYSLVVEKFPYECKICELPTWGTGYACPDLICYNFIHESCIDTPRVMHHPLHPHHPLTRPGFTLESRLIRCGVCKQDFNLRNLTTYNCGECEFALHSQCAISRLRPIKLKCHKHSLVSVLIGVPSTSRCSVCRKPFMNHGLSCVECDDFFHVECISVPREWKHERHEHTLNLMDRIIPYAYIQSEYPCDICEGTIKEAANVYVYGCNLCEFYAHFECVLSKIKQIKEAVHDHPHNGNNKLCGMCNLQINGQACAYDGRLGFWVHEECAAMPHTLDGHPLHPAHKLHLSRRLYSTLAVCDICRDASKGFHFHCRLCEFFIDVKCALLSEAEQTFYDEHRVGKTLKHPLHQEHELTLARFRTDLRKQCNMCGEELLGPSYFCRRCCDFWGFHKTCTEWPGLVEGHPVAPHHLLRLGHLRQLPEVPQCLACGYPIRSFIGYKAEDSERGILYYHIECGSSLARPFRCRGHPHQFYYVHDKPSKGVLEDPRLILICASCGEEAVNSYCRCLKCSLYFHAGCLRKAKWIPSTARHEQHVHWLSFKEECIDYGGYYCDTCEEPRDSRHPCYACDDCEFVVHIECIVSEENASSVTLKEIESDDVKIPQCSSD